MKLLVFSHDVGFSASGIVAKEIILELSKRSIDLLVVCERYEKDDIKSIDTISYPSGISNQSTLDKVLYIIFKRDMRYRQWINSVYNLHLTDCQNFKPTHILGLSSAQTDMIPRITYRMARALNLAYHLHTFDAFPAPVCWGNNHIFRKAIGSSVTKFFRAAKSLSAANPAMLSYLVEYHSLACNQPREVIYNPFKHNLQDLCRSDGEYFLYLGSLDIRRDGRAYLLAIREILESKRSVKFIFAGTSEEIMARSLGEFRHHNLVVLPFTSDLKKLIADAKCLVDIDIDETGDVNVSSKLMKYLSTNKPILSITSVNSPTHQMLYENGLENVYINHHDTEALVPLILEIDKGISRESNKTNRYNFRKNHGVDVQVSCLLDLMVS